MTRFINLNPSDKNKFIYRYLSFSRLVEIFSTNTYQLINPSLWDDPYEQWLTSAKFDLGSDQLDLGFRNSFFGSCWTKKNSSNAMWRIYSPDKSAVRIRTTPKLLGDAIQQALGPASKSIAFIGKVQYLSQAMISEKAESLAIATLSTQSELAAAKSLLIKRSSFSHEEEVRILLVDRSFNEKVLPISIDPHNVIQSVMIDSRAPIELIDVYKKYLKDTLGFKGRVSKSTLYDHPPPLNISIR